ncbi:hypothetical protein KSS87_012230 [Heliosperma pusillum]|nr:hypothetical protein KSS87_012230 [Heliosperma pusillum]
MGLPAPSLCFVISQFCYVLAKVREELDTKYGGPSYLSVMLRRFHNPPQLAASLVLRVQYDKREKLGYVVRGKLGFPVLSDDSVRFNVKGRCDIDKDLKQVHACGFNVYSSVAIIFQKMSMPSIQVSCLFLPLSSFICMLTTQTVVATYYY